jgi:dephospho-CoA kinase
VAVRLLRVALTGGIATGKSHCLAGFAARGVPVLDADHLARQATLPGSAGIAAILERFGRAAIRADGALDRPALARIVFADPAARRDLEAIIHPIVYRAVRNWFAGEEAALERAPAAGTSHPGFAMADIPLLYETGNETGFDRVVVAACRPDQQLQRLMARDQLPEEDARQRIASQLPIDLKRQRADYVIDTSTTLEDTDRQVNDVFERLSSEAVRPITNEAG